MGQILSIGVAITSNWSLDLNYRAHMGVDNIKGLDIEYMTIVNRA